MLRSAATMSDANVRNRVAEVLAVIEPAAVIFIGLFIGLIVVSIFTAITSINQIPL
jgi:type II secretory pathway component PulF